MWSRWSPVRVRSLTPQGSSATAGFSRGSCKRCLASVVLPVVLARPEFRGAKRRRKRRHGGGLSKRPEARARQLANLRAGSVEAGTAAGPGNTRSLQHGAYRAISRDQLDRKTREVFDALAADVPLKDDGELPAPDALTVRLLAETLIRLESIGAFLNRKGWEDGDGRVRRWSRSRSGCGIRRSISPNRSAVPREVAPVWGWIFSARPRWIWPRTGRPRMNRSRARPRRRARSERPTPRRVAAATPRRTRAVGRRSR